MKALILIIPLLIASLASGHYFTGIDPNVGMPSMQEQRPTQNSGDTPVVRKASINDGPFHQDSGPTLTSPGDDVFSGQQGDDENHRYHDPFSPEGNPASSDRQPDRQGMDIILSVDVSDGQVTWLLNGRTFKYDSFFISDGKLYLSSEGGILCIDAYTGELLWGCGNGEIEYDPLLRAFEGSTSQYFPEATLLTVSNPSSTAGFLELQELLWRLSSDDETDAGPISYGCIGD